MEAIIPVSGTSIGPTTLYGVVVDNLTSMKTPNIATSSSSVSTPAVINDVKQGQAGSASNIQGAVNGINALIHNSEQFDMSPLIARIGAAAVAAGQKQEAVLLEAGEKATMAFAGQEGVTGITFNFIPIKFAPQTAAQITSTSSNETETSTKTGQSGPNLPRATAWTDLLASSQSAPTTFMQAQAKSTISPSTSEADVALSLLAKQKKVSDNASIQELTVTMPMSD